jgi:hypothetical protein
MMGPYVCPNPSCGTSFRTNKEMNQHFYRSSCFRAMASTDLLDSSRRSAAAASSGLPPAGTHPAPAKSLPPAALARTPQAHQQQSSSLLANKGRTPPRNSFAGDPLTGAPVSKKAMIQHDGGQRLPGAASTNPPTSNWEEGDFPADRGEEVGGDSFDYFTSHDDDDLEDSEDMGTDKEEDIVKEDEEEDDKESADKEQDNASAYSTHNHATDGNQLQLLATSTYIDRRADHVYPFSKGEMAVIDLLRIVGEERLPLGSFDSIRRWANNWSMRGTDFVAVAQHSRKVSMKSISTKIGYDALAPDHQRIELPRAMEVYNLPVFSFVASFSAMLADSRLMREEFLQFSDSEKAIYWLLLQSDRKGLISGIAIPTMVNTTAIPTKHQSRKTTSSWLLQCFSLIALTLIGRHG